MEKINIKDTTDKKTENPETEPVHGNREIKRKTRRKRITTGRSLVLRVAPQQKY